MKLILSTSDFHEEKPRRVIIENLPHPAEECRVLFIPNENATPENLKNDMYFRRMRQKGFKKGNISVFDHTRPRDFFGQDYDVVYISGGNTFLTMRKLRETGFDGELLRLIASGATYIGGSAGAHIVTKSIAHIVRYDPLPEGFHDFSGLGLLDGVLICHFCKEREAHFEELKSAGERVWALRNEDSIIVTENGMEFR